MERLKKDVPLQLCYVPIYQVGLHCFKISYNNCRSLHKHFPQIQNESNILASDVLGFSETRLTSADVVENYQLQGHTAVFNHEARDDLGRRPHHGTALCKKYSQNKSHFSTQQWFHGGHRSRRTFTPN